MGSVAGNCLACHSSVRPLPGGGLAAGPLRYGFMAATALDLLRILLVAVTALFIYIGARRYYARWTRGGQKLGEGLRFSLGSFAANALLQRRVLARRRSLFHLPVYAGAVLLLAAGVMFLASPARCLSPYASPSRGYYEAFRVLANIGGLAMAIGLAMALARRGAGRIPWVLTSPEDVAIDLWLLALLYTGALVDAATAAAHYGSSPPAWDIAGRLFAPLWLGVDVRSFAATFQAVQLIHLAVAVMTFGIAAYTKLGHIAVSSLNTGYPRPPGWAARPEPEAEKRIEEGGTIGVVRLEDTWWKQRLDLDACTMCGRCAAACPAANTGKPLVPMLLVTKLRDEARKDNWGQELVPTVLKPEEVWSCTTCRACVEACPVLIHHVELMHDLRRGLVSRGEHVPDELLQVSYNLMRTGNPYGSDPYEREQWLQELAEKGLVEIAEPGKEYDLLLWAGCAPSYDPRLRGTVEALLRLLKRAGLSVAVALEQQCCGEPARRIGDELMFQELVKMNKEALEQYRFKKILVTCPHGLQVLRHEYPQYGARWEVVHHSQLLAQLIREGRLKPTRKLDIAVTYHDPCYLGRWNRIYDDPRLVVRASIRELREMKRSRENSFCCGGGGGGVFYDPKIGERISRARMQEAKNTGARAVAVACPFCNIMLSAEAPDFDMEVKDIAELLDEATREEQ